MDISKAIIRNIDYNALWDAKIYIAQTKQAMGQVVTEALAKLVNEENDGEIEQRVVVVDEHHG